MPNYKLSTRINEEIRNTAQQLCWRRLEYQLLDPPITVEQVQDSATPPDLLAQMRALQSDGVRVGAEEKNVPVVLRAKGFAGLQRDVLLRLDLPRVVLLRQSTYCYTAS